MKTRLLVTGFEPFGGHQVNPSWAGLAARQKWPNGVVTKQLPVAWQAVDKLLPSLIAELTPERILMFGVHGGQDSSGRSAQTFYVERFAVNHDAAAVADNAGEARQGAPIDESLAADFRREGFGIDSLFETLLGANFSAAISEDAGRYLCNHSYYRALEQESHAAWLNAVAFVHVPPMRAMHPNGLELPTYTKAYEILINTFLDLELPSGHGL